MKLAALSNGVTVSGSFSGAAVSGVWSPWVELTSGQSVPLALGGCSLVSNDASPGHQLQFGVGGAGFEAQVGPTVVFGFYGGSSGDDQITSALIAAPWELAVLPAGSRLSFRWLPPSTGASRVTNVSVALRPVSRP